MRTRLLLVVLSIPVLCAVVPRHADAQRDRARSRVYVNRDGRGYRDRIYIPRHRYKEPVVRYRYDDRHRDQYRYRDDYRYRDELRYRNQYRYRDRDRYEYRRHRTSIGDLILIAAREAAYRDRYRHRHGRGGRGIGIYIDL